jgi:protein-S-isoprenylcysteine O-methyltransferase Ste14
MRATALEFRLRVAIIFIVIWLGFWSPWIEGWGLGRRIALLERLPLEISRIGLFPFTAAAPAVIVVAALIAAFAAALRIWATAYLGPGTVNSTQMKAGAVLADGPYRYVRNPLYIGLWCMIAAMAFLMPATGALFVIVLLTVFLLRLILAEEAFLAGRLGEAYRAYLHSVPRLFPRLKTTVPPTGQKPQWFHAVVAEVNPVGVFFIMAVLSWSYDNRLMVRAILVSFGVSLVVRALMPRAGEKASPAE